MSNRLRVAVVEMTILVRSKHDPSLTDTLMKTLQSPEGRRERRQQVIAILDALDAREAPQTDLVIFPGWTLVGKSVPRWFREATNQWTTVVEMLPSEGGSKAKAYREWRTHVLPPTTTPGSVGVGASTQRLHETAASAVERQALLQDLRRSRDWEIVGHPPAGAALLVQRGPARIAEGGAGVKARRLGSRALPHIQPRAAACPRHHSPRPPSIPSPPFTSSSLTCSAA